MLEITNAYTAMVNCRVCKSWYAVLFCIMVISWWCRDMDTIFALLALWVSKQQVTHDRASNAELLYSLLLAVNRCWTNTLVAGDLRHLQNVMLLQCHSMMMNTTKSLYHFMPAGSHIQCPQSQNIQISISYIIWRQWGLVLASTHLVIIPFGNGLATVLTLNENLNILLLGGVF